MVDTRVLSRWVVLRNSTALDRLNQLKLRTESRWIFLSPGHFKLVRGSQPTISLPTNMPSTWLRFGLGPPAIENSVVLDVGEVPVQSLHKIPASSRLGGMAFHCGELVAQLQKVREVLLGIAKRGGVAAIIMNLGMTPFGGIPIYSTYELYRQYIQQNSWVKLHYDAARYLARPVSTVEQAKHFITEALGGSLTTGYTHLALHIRIGDKCVDCAVSAMKVADKLRKRLLKQKLRRARGTFLDGLDTPSTARLLNDTNGSGRHCPKATLFLHCFSVSGLVWDEDTFWKRVKAKADQINASHIFIASNLDPHTFASGPGWDALKPRVVTTHSHPLVTELTGFEVSLLEQAVCERARLFLYTAESTIGQKILLPDGAMAFRNSGDRKPQIKGSIKSPAKLPATDMKFPPNTSTWAVIVLMRRLANDGSMSANLSFEELLGVEWRLTPEKIKKYRDIPRYRNGKPYKSNLRLDVPTRC